MDRNTSVTTYSRQHLVVNEELNNSGSSEIKQNYTNSSHDDAKITKKEWITVLILCFVNLINYMDRMTVPAVLDELQKDFKIDNDNAGLLQTAFIISYMIFAPLFGYLGDRYNRKIIMSIGIFLWCLTTLIGSYMPTFHWFLFSRMCVGIGEASYSTIAPTIISDLFVKDTRSKMLALFYFAIPVGSGLGYITGSEMMKLAGGKWQWGLRLTPPLGIIAIILIYLFVRDPPKGEKEGGSHVASTTWCDDIKSLIKNPSFMLSTGGFTCVAFVTGALSFWAPKFLQAGINLQKENDGVKFVDSKDDGVKTVSLIFGVIAMVAGLIGVPFGSFMAQRLRVTWQQADPLICAGGLLVSAPFIFFSLLTAAGSTYFCYALIFFGQLTLNLNWSIVADILLYIVIPTRRSTAEAFQILIAHALGDAGSPYLIGVMSEAMKPIVKNLWGNPSEISVDFYSLQYSLFLTIFIEVVGSLFFFLTALHIEKDKSVVDLTIAGESSNNPPSRKLSKQNSTEECL